jgi:hypothetical protein
MQGTVGHQVRSCTHIDRRETGKGILHGSCQFYSKLFSHIIIPQRGNIDLLGNRGVGIIVILSKAIDKLIVQINIYDGSDGIIGNAGLGEIKPGKLSGNGYGLTFIYHAKPRGGKGRGIGTAVGPFYGPAIAKDLKVRYSLGDMVIIANKKEPC